MAKLHASTARRLVSATLLVYSIGGWPHEVRAETQVPPFQVPPFQVPPSQVPPSQAAPAPTFSRTALDHIGDYVRNEVATGKIPGAVLLIQQHGKPVYFETFGVRDPETAQPMTADAIFQIYSMSKAVTSVAAMMLVDDGRLALDDPVSKYIHAFADAKVGVDLSDEAGQYPLKLEPLKR
ncbi:MAG: beta-lactamase family protein, partial [Bradyrhizobium sp.]|nr:beta-lactamase family protein [Bradyrhizobium sp.]